jgi:hypothetical protein
MRYHGNYCGPNWSAGQHQLSVTSDVPAIDDFDETCKMHDAAYATATDLEAADWQFAADNLATTNPKRWLAGGLVGVQGLVRSLDRLTTPITKSPNTMQNMQTRVLKPSLRGAKALQRPASETGVTTVAAPAVIGSVIRGQRSVTIRKDRTSISLSVSTCVGRPAAASQALLPEVIACQYLTPLTLGNDEVQNMTRVYQHFRIKRATIHFRAFQGTNTGGEVMIVANDDPNYKPINTSIGSAFYQKSLNTQHSTMTPIWCNTSMELPVDSGWKVCDNNNSTTIEEFASGVFYIYSDGGTAIAGYFLVDMDIDFEGLRFNPRNLVSGSFLGLGQRFSATTPIGTLNANATLTITQQTVGDIYAVVLSSTGATFGTGSTSNTLFALQSGSGSNPFTVTGSLLLYGRANTTSSMDLFTTYDSAIGSDTSDRLIYGVTTTTVTTFPTVVITQLRNSTQPGV